MSKQIDLSKPLSEADKEYLRQMGREQQIAQVEAGGEDSSATAGPRQLKNGPTELENVPNTGDVNTLGRAETGGATGSVPDLAPSVGEEGYEGLKVPQLQDELERRGLPKSGTKPELIARLEEDDESSDDDDDDDEDDGS